MTLKKTLLFIAAALLIFFGLNLMASLLHARYDLTQDGRYTLSQTSKNILKKANYPIIVDVFLEGDIPAGFIKLKAETRQLLEEYASVNPQVKFEFINPISGDESAAQSAQHFASRGMAPEQVQVRSNGKVSQEIVFPWAQATYRGKTVKIPLLKKVLGANQDELISRSTQNLEYAFSDAFYKVLNPRSKRIAVLKGNGELPDAHIADFFTTLRESYFIAPFPLDSILSAPENTFKALQQFDLIVAAKPTIAFRDAQKYALDQYIINGGKSLWLIDPVAMETDSLYAHNGTTVAINRDLNLNDMFFKYGLRINPVLVEDLYAAPLVLATGEGAQSQYRQVPWFYYPLATPPGDHPINTNLDNPIRFEYTGQIDLLKNNIDKTVLLKSSQLSKINGVPLPISLEGIDLQPDPQRYTAGPQNLAVLLEGNFTSSFKNRLIPLKVNGYRFRESDSLPNKMIVVADGDLIRNELDKNGRPLELGFDKFTFKEYGNKEFLLNAVNYLLDDTGLINIRSKTIDLPALDLQRASEERPFWQGLMLGLPLAVVVIFALIFTYLRKRRYR